MKPEVLFFRYAFPCTRVIMDRGDMDQDSYSRLEELAKEGKAPPFKELEQVYKNAFVIMKKLYGNKYRSKHSIESYWRGGGHNNEIDNNPDYKDRTEDFKKLCRVRKVVVTGKAPYFRETSSWLMIKETGISDEQVVWNPYNVEIKKGDEVNIHHNIIVEKATTI